MSKEKIGDVIGAIESWEIWSDWNEAQRVVLKDVLFYLEQAEQVEGLLRSGRFFERGYHQYDEENKRYREQLKLIISDTHCKEHEYVSVRHLIRKRAEKALEGDSNE